MNQTTKLRSLLMVLCIISFSLLLNGCGGSEEAMAEDEMVTDIGVEEETPQETTETPAETTEEPSNADAETTPESAQGEQVTPAEPVQEGPTKEQLQSELDGLKTENIQLKDQLSNTEQTNRDLLTKISDLEAANQALKKQNERQPVSHKAASRPAAPGKSSSDEIRAYESSVAKFNTKSYLDAISEFQTLLNTGIKDDYADNCHYWIGLSYFQLKEYTTAVEHLQQVMNYRFSEKKDDAQLIVAQSYERMGNKEKALAEYKKLLDLYPTSEYVGRAKAKLR